MKILLGRRDFLKQSALGAALSLSQPAVWSASRQDLRRTDHPKKLIFVGAGMAGLAAAYQLVETGHDVTLLEARARPGGLVGTLREPFSDGLYADAGALFIPENHDIVLKYVKLFSLPLKPSFPQGLARVYCLQGRRFEVAEGEEPEWPLNLTAGRRRFGVNGLGAWNQWGDGVDTVSALVVLRGAALRRYARQFFRIDSGNDRLPRAFARQLGERIRYEAPVARIERRPQNVRVVFQKSGKHETMTADHVICAIPLSTLRHIEISPPLSPEKRAAIAELPYSSATRVFLQMRRKFWIDEGLSGWALTDLPISSISEAPANETGRRGILATYMLGAAARDFASLKEDERIERTLEQAEKIFPGTRQSFERGTSIAWDGIPWSRGAAPWMRPGQVTALLPHLARPEGRAHFAGDHTSVWMRWMQGALESGHRAAREVHEAT